MTAYRERRSCSVLKPAKDWLRIIPLGPPGEWVPAAMISGMRDDTPGEKTDIQISHVQSHWQYLNTKWSIQRRGHATHHGYNKSIFWPQLTPNHVNRKVNWSALYKAEQSRHCWWRLPRAMWTSSIQSRVRTCLDSAGRPVTTQLQTYLNCFMFSFLGQGVAKHDSCHFPLSVVFAFCVPSTWTKRWTPLRMQFIRLTAVYKPWMLRKQKLTTCLRTGPRIFKGNLIYVW